MFYSVDDTKTSLHEEYRWNNLTDLQKKAEIVRKIEQNEAHQLLNFIVIGGLLTICFPWISIPCWLGYGAYKLINKVRNAPQTKISFKADKGSK